MIQTQLPLDRPESKPDPTPLIKCLRGRGWITARQLYRLLGFNDRKVRAIAAASEGQIISGQLGYKLTLEATLEEVQHAEAWLHSQSKQMDQRALEIRRVYHRKITPDVP